MKGRMDKRRARTASLKDHVEASKEVLLKVGDFLQHPEYLEDQPDSKELAFLEGYFSTLAMHYQRCSSSLVVTLAYVWAAYHLGKDDECLAALDLLSSRNDELLDTHAELLIKMYENIQSQAIFSAAQVEVTRLLAEGKTIEVKRQLALLLPIENKLTSEQLDWIKSHTVNANKDVYDAAMRDRSKFQFRIDDHHVGLSNVWPTYGMFDFFSKGRRKSDARYSNPKGVQPALDNVDSSFKRSGPR